MVIDYKMINDTVDILDAKVVNFGILLIIADEEKNKFDVLQKSIDAIKFEIY
jgi:hypothetical protein